MHFFRIAYIVGKGIPRNLYFTQIFSAADDESWRPHTGRGNRFDATFANDGASTPTRNVFIDAIGLVLDIDRSVLTLRRRHVVTSRDIRYAVQVRGGVYVGRGI